MDSVYSINKKDIYIYSAGKTPVPGKFKWNWVNLGHDKVHLFLSDVF